MTGCMRMVVSVAALAAAACGGNQPEETNARPAPDLVADTTAHGIVRVVGADPITTVVLDVEGRHIALRGALLSELERLVGATVRVRGRPMANQPPPPQHAVDVADYEVLSVNGVRPVVGILRLGHEGARIEGDSTITLASVPAGLSAMSGAKVWVIGRMDGGRLVVQSYGIIREPDA